MQHKIVYGTGLMDGYGGEYEFGNGVLSGGASSYNMFVKKYAKKHRLSIPEAAHAIKRKKLWKGTTTKRKKRTTLKRSRTTVKRRPVKRSTVKRCRTVCKPRTRVKRRMRGRGVMGGATIEDLEKEISKHSKKIKNQKTQSMENKKFHALECQRLKNLYLNAPLDDPELNDLKTSYIGCVSGSKSKMRGIIPRLTSYEKDFLLYKLLETFDPTFSFIKKTIEMRSPGPSIPTVDEII